MDGWQSNGCEHCTHVEIHGDSYEKQVPLLSKLGTVVDRGSGKHEAVKAPLHDFILPHSRPRKADATRDLIVGTYLR